MDIVLTAHNLDSVLEPNAVISVRNPLNVAKALQEAAAADSKRGVQLFHGFLMNGRKADVVKTLRKMKEVDFPATFAALATMLWLKPWTCAEFKDLPPQKSVRDILVELEWARVALLQDGNPSKKFAGALMTISSTVAMASCCAKKDMTSVERETTNQYFQAYQNLLQNTNVLDEMLASDPRAVQFLFRHEATLQHLNYKSEEAKQKLLKYCTLLPAFFLENDTKGDQIMIILQARDSIEELEDIEAFYEAATEEAADFLFESYFNNFAQRVIYFKLLHEESEEKLDKIWLGNRSADVLEDNMHLQDVPTRYLSPKSMAWFFANRLENPDLAPENIQKIKKWTAQHMRHWSEEDMAKFKEKVLVLAKNQAKETKGQGYEKGEKRDTLQSVIYSALTWDGYDTERIVELLQGIKIYIPSSKTLETVNALEKIARKDPVVREALDAAIVRWVQDGFSQLAKIRFAKDGVRRMLHIYGQGGGEPISTLKSFIKNCFELVQDVLDSEKISCINRKQELILQAVRIAAGLHRDNLAEFDKINDMTTSQVKYSIFQSMGGMIEHYPLPSTAYEQQFTSIIVGILCHYGAFTRYVVILNDPAKPDALFPDKSNEDRAIELIISKRMMELTEHVLQAMARGQEIPPPIFSIQCSRNQILMEASNIEKSKEENRKQLGRILDLLM